MLIVVTEIEVKEEKKENEENAQDDGCTKIVIGNWPSTLNEMLLTTLFSRFGEVKSSSIVNECGIVEYDFKSEAERAMKQMNGFKIGNGNLAISYATEQISHILSMDDASKKTEEDDEDTQELIDGFEQIEAPKDMKHRKSIFEEQTEEIAEMKQQNSSKMEENEKETPNESDIAEMVRTENEKEFAEIIHDERSSNDKNEEEEVQNAEIAPNDDNPESSSSTDDFDSSSFSDSSSSSDSLNKSKNLKRTLSKKQLKRLKKKQKRRKRRKAKRKKNKKRKQRGKYVEKNIVALNECLEKITNLALKDIVQPLVVNALFFKF